MFYFFLFCVCFFPLHANADALLARQSVLEFLSHSLQNSEQSIEIKIGNIPLENYAPCTAYQTFLPNNTRLIGKTHIGLRCISPTQWEMMLPIHIAVLGEYVVASRHLNRLQMVQKEDLLYQTGDLTQLPFGALTKIEQAQGLILLQSVRAGKPLLQSFLKKPSIIETGQRVRLIYSGKNFAVQSEGIAQQSASAGDSLQVKMPNGQKIIGTCDANGNVLVQPNL